MRIIANSLICVFYKTQIILMAKKKKIKIKYGYKKKIYFFISNKEGMDKYLNIASGLTGSICFSLSSSCIACICVLVTCYLTVVFLVAWILLGITYFMSLIAFALGLLLIPLCFLLAVPCCIAYLIYPAMQGGGTVLRLVKMNDDGEPLMDFFSSIMKLKDQNFPYALLFYALIAVLFSWTVCGALTLISIAIGFFMPFSIPLLILIICVLSLPFACIGCLMSMLGSVLIITDPTDSVKTSSDSPSAATGGSAVYMAEF